MDGDALLVIDVQRDFCAGGALAVPGGDEVVPILNSLMDSFRTTVVTQDLHPPNHCSFVTQGGPWPVHCVVGSPGAELHPDLRRDSISHTVASPTPVDSDAFSAFERADLASWLHKCGVSCLFVGGLATEYTVKATVLDALRLGFGVTLLLDCTRSVDITPHSGLEQGDGESAIREMVDAGALVLSGSLILQRKERAACS